MPADFTLQVVFSYFPGRQKLICQSSYLKFLASTIFALLNVLVRIYGRTDGQTDRGPDADWI
jgi:hypothetical protein